MTSQGLLEMLAESRARLLAAIGGVTEEQFKRRPEDGGRCIAEVLAQQLASERRQAGRIREALSQDGAIIEVAEPEAVEAQTRAGRTAPVPQLIHGLLAARREIEMLIAQAETLPGGLERSVTHPREGRLSIQVLAGEKVARRELLHVEQIEALKTAFGI